MSDFLTVEQTAERLNVTDRTIRNMIVRGSLPGSYRIDPQMPKSPWRVPLTAVERIEQQRLGLAVERNG